MTKCCQIAIWLMLSSIDALVLVVKEPLTQAVQFGRFIQSLVFFLHPSLCISWTSEKNGIQTVQVTSTDNVIQTNSRK